MKVSVFPVRPTSELHLENSCLKLNRNSIHKHILASIFSGVEVFCRLRCFFLVRGRQELVQLHFPSSLWSVKFRYYSISLKRGMYTINKVVNKLTIKIINTTLIILQVLPGILTFILYWICSHWTLMCNAFHVFPIKTCLEIFMLIHVSNSIFHCIILKIKLIQITN